MMPSPVRVAERDRQTCWSLMSGGASGAGRVRTRALVPYGSARSGCSSLRSHALAEHAVIASQPVEREPRAATSRPSLVRDRLRRQYTSPSHDSLYLRRPRITSSAGLERPEPKERGGPDARGGAVAVAKSLCMVGQHSACALVHRGVNPGVRQGVVECAPVGGEGQAAVLTGGGARDVLICREQGLPPFSPTHTISRRPASSNQVP